MSRLSIYECLAFFKLAAHFLLSVDSIAFNSAILEYFNCEDIDIKEIDIKEIDIKEIGMKEIDTKEILIINT